MAAAASASAAVDPALLAAVWSNPPPGRADTVALLVRVLDTVVRQPGEAKFRAVSIAKTHAKLGAAKGAVAYLHAAGFTSSATHYELAATADLGVVKRHLDALDAYSAAHPPAPPATATAPASAAAKPTATAASDAKAHKVVAQAFKPKSEEDDTARQIAEIERKKKERKRLEELRKKDKAQDYKPVCSSTANALSFGATKGSLPPPKKSA